MHNAVPIIALAIEPYAKGRGHEKWSPRKLIFTALASTLGPLLLTAPASAQTLNCTQKNTGTFVDTVTFGGTTTGCIPSNNDGLIFIANPDKVSTNEDLILAGGGNNVAVHQYFRGNNDTAGAMKIYIGDSAVTGTSVSVYGNMNLNGNAITGVANGALTVSSTDAVNGSQLYATNLVANGALQRTGGTLTGSVNMGSNALTGLTAATLSANSTDAVTGSQLYATNLVANGALQRSGGTLTGSVNMGSNALTGLTAATLSANSTDAVNGSQLYTTNLVANGALQRSGGTLTGSVNMGSNALTGLTTATLSANSTDAVTGSQLYATNLVANGALQRSGGVMTGALNMGGYALSGLSAGTLSTNSTDAVSGNQLYATNLQVAATVQVANGALQRAGGVMTGALNMGGYALNGLNAGTLSASSTDAVNGSQLYATNQQVAATVQVANGALQRSGGVMTGALNMGGYALSGLSAGTLSANSTDAVNGSQLYAVQQAVSSVGQTSAGAVATANGALQRSGGVMTGGLDMGGYALNGLSAGTLSAASTSAVNGSQLYATNQQVAATVQVANGALQRTGGLMAGALNMGGYALSGLAAGTLSASSTDAVNGNQLYSTNQQVAATVQVANGALQRSGGVMTGSLDMGGFALSGVTAGALSASSTEAVNGSQLYALQQGLSGVSQISAGAVATANGALQRTGGTMAGGLDMGGHTLTGLGTPVNATDAVNKDYVDQLVAGVAGAATIFDGAGQNSYQSGSSVAQGSGAVAIGMGQSATGSGAVAIGDPNTAAGTGAVAIGANNTATGTGAVAIGNNNSALADAAVAVGDGAVAQGQHAVAVGANSAAQADGVAVGYNAKAAQQGSTAVGTNAATTRANQVMVGGTGTSVAVGDVAASTAAQVGPTNVATVDANGTIGQDTTIRPAIAALQAGGREQANQMAALQAADAMQNGRLGALEAGQRSLQNQVMANSKDANAGIAAAMAMGGTVIPPGSVIAVSFNIANYRGQQGVSVSAIARVHKNVYISGGFSGSTMRGSSGSRVGVTLAW